MHKTGPAKIRGAMRLVLVLAVLAMPVLAGGCIEDAEDSEFVFNNPNDPEPGSTDDDDDSTGTEVAIIHVNIQGEVVVISNQGTLSVDLTGWTLKDDEPVLDETYTFPAFELPQGGFARIHTEAGNDVGNDLFWDGGDHWSAGDTALLSHSDGTLVSTCSDGDDCWDD